MEHRRAKTLGIAVLLAAFFLASVNSMAASSLSVLDTDPSTYVIVVMLMLFIFMLFSLKEDLKFEFRPRNVAYSVAIFAAYLLILSYLRVAMSFSFMSYRVDALLFPLLLAAMVTALFGLDGVRKTKYMIIYAVFASPLLLLPLFSLNNAFAHANAALVYGVLKAAGVPVTSSGLIISVGTVSSVTVSTTCVSLGIFAAFVMFMLPVAYLYEGRARSKVLWVVSGCALMLALNVLRMSGLSLIWAYYGISAAVNTLHAFAGQVLFYIGIIAMVLLAYKYGLYVKQVKKARKKKATGKEGLCAWIAVPAAVAIAFGLMALFLSSQYGSALNAPAISFASRVNASNATASIYELRSIENAHDNVAQIGPSEAGRLFALKDNSTGIMTFIVATPMAGPGQEAAVASYEESSALHAYLLKNGVAIKSAIMRSGNMSFYVNYFSLPYSADNASMTINYELFRNANNASAPSCAEASVRADGLPNYVESAIYNAEHLYFGSVGSGIMCESYRIAGAST
jgi:exosortase/archaeosortase family protein